MYGSFLRYNSTQQAARKSSRPAVLYRSHIFAAPSCGPFANSPRKQRGVLHLTVRPFRSRAIQFLAVLLAGK